MPIAEKSPDSEQELRWRTWQQKGRRADLLAEKRMKVLFSVVGLIVLGLILYYTFAPNSDHLRNPVGSDFNSLPTKTALGSAAWLRPNATVFLPARLAHSGCDRCWGNMRFTA